MSEKYEKLEVETRPCKDCKNYLELPFNRKSCDKKLMGVIPEMKVAYYKSVGTCFEPKFRN